MITNMNKLKNILELKSVKPTYIRLKILSYLLDNKEHPTVEMIYKRLLKEIPTISRTSVYNALNTFSEKGLTLPIVITGTETRFDYKVFPHHHFLCESCGKILDLEIECMHFKKGYIDGHKINELHGYFIGICEICVNEKEA